MTESDRAWHFTMTVERVVDTVTVHLLRETGGKYPQLLQINGRVLCFAERKETKRNYPRLNTHNRHNLEHSPTLIATPVHIFLKFKRFYKLNNYWKE